MISGVVFPTALAAAGLAEDFQTYGSVDYGSLYGTMSLPDAFFGDLIDAERCFTPVPHTGTHTHVSESYKPSVSMSAPDAVVPANLQQQLSPESPLTFPAHMSPDRFSHRPGELLMLDGNAFPELSIQQLSPCSLPPAGAGLLRATSLPVDVSCNGPVPLLQLQQLLLEQQQEQQDLQLEVLALQLQACQLQQQVQQQQQQAVASPTYVIEGHGTVIQAPDMQPQQTQCTGMEVAFQGTNAITGAAAVPSPAAPGAYASANTLLPPLTTHDTLQVPHASSRATDQRRYSMLHLPSPSMWAGEGATACQADGARSGRPRAASMLLLQTPGNLLELVEQHAAAAGLGMAAHGGGMYPTSPSTSTHSSRRSSSTIEPEAMLQAMQSPLYQQVQVPRGSAASSQALCSRRNTSGQFNSRTRFSLDVVIEGKPGVVTSPLGPHQRQWQQSSPMLDNHGSAADSFAPAMSRARCASLDLPKSRECDAVTAMGAAKGDCHENSTDKGPASPAGAPGLQTSWEGRKEARASFSSTVSCNMVHWHPS